MLVINNLQQKQIEIPCLLDKDSDKIRYLVKNIRFYWRPKKTCIYGIEFSVKRTSGSGYGRVCFVND